MVQKHEIPGGNPMIGYKIAQCRIYSDNTVSFYSEYNQEFTYKVGETYHENRDELKLCVRGLHFCENLSLCAQYYEGFSKATAHDPNLKIRVSQVVSPYLAAKETPTIFCIGSCYVAFKVSAYGLILEDTVRAKFAAEHLRIDEIITPSEIEKLLDGNVSDKRGINQQQWVKGEVKVFDDTLPSKTQLCEFESLVKEPSLTRTLRSKWKDVLVKSPIPGEGGQVLYLAKTCQPSDTIITWTFSRMGVSWTPGCARGSVRQYIEPTFTRYVQKLDIYSDQLCQLFKDVSIWLKLSSVSEPVVVARYILFYPLRENRNNTKCLLRYTDITGVSVRAKHDWGPAQDGPTASKYADVCDAFLNDSLAFNTLSTVNKEVETIFKNGPQKLEKLLKNTQSRVYGHDPNLFNFKKIATTLKL